MKNVDFRAMFRRARPHGEGEARALSGMKGHLCALLITLVIFAAHFYEMCIRDRLYTANRGRRMKVITAITP